MISKLVRGVFVTGSDTNVGKTYVASLIARQLSGRGHHVGVYKPAASGCHPERGGLVSGDARSLWEAAGRPATLDHVCPQRFALPLAPHLAARAEGKELDADLLVHGLDFWRNTCDVVVVEGIGGLMSPVTDERYAADLAWDFGFPLVIVVRNALGAIHQALTTLMAASSFRGGLPVAGIVMNAAPPGSDDPSTPTNADELRRRAAVPVLAEIGWEASEMSEPVDWYSLARPSRHEHPAD